MYTREIYKKMFSAIPDTLPSTDSTSYNSVLINSTSLSIFPGNTTRAFGMNYGVTITATTGGVYILPSNDTTVTEPTSSNSYYVGENEVVTLRVPYLLNVKGDSTTSKFKAAIWSDER